MEHGYQPLIEDNAGLLSRIVNLFHKKTTERHSKKDKGLLAEGHARFFSYGTANEPRTTQAPLEEGGYRPPLPR